MSLAILPHNKCKEKLAKGVGIQKHIEKYLADFRNRHEKSSYDMAKEIKPDYKGWTPYGTYDEQDEIYSLTKSFSLNLGTPLYSSNWEHEYYSPSHLVDAIEKEYEYLINNFKGLSGINKKYEGRNIPVYYIYTLYDELINLLAYIKNDEQYKTIYNQMLGIDPFKVQLVDTKTEFYMHKLWLKSTSICLVALVFLCSSIYFSDRKSNWWFVGLGLVPTLLWDLANSKKVFFNSFKFLLSKKERTRLAKEYRITIDIDFKDKGKL